MSQSLLVVAKNDKKGRRASSQPERREPAKRNKWAKPDPASEAGETSSQAADAQETAAAQVTADDQSGTDRPDTDRQESGGSQDDESNTDKQESDGSRDRHETDSDRLTTSHMWARMI